MPKKLTFSGITKTTERNYTLKCKNTSNIVEKGKNRGVIIDSRLLFAGIKGYEAKVSKWYGCYNEKRIFELIQRNHGKTLQNLCEIFSGIRQSIKEPNPEEKEKVVLDKVQ